MIAPRYSIRVWYTDGRPDGETKKAFWCWTYFGALNRVHNLNRHRLREDHAFYVWDRKKQRRVSV